MFLKFLHWYVRTCSWKTEQSALNFNWKLSLSLRKLPVLNRPKRCTIRMHNGAVTINWILLYLPTDTLICWLFQQYTKTYVLKSLPRWNRSNQGANVKVLKCYPLTHLPVCSSVHPRTSMGQAHQTTIPAIVKTNKLNCLYAAQVVVCIHSHPLFLILSWGKVDPKDDDNEARNGFVYSLS